MRRVLPILFNTEMVRANLDGRKSCTRRLVKGFVPDDAIWGYTAFTPKGYISCRGTFADGYGEKFFKLPYQTGDILYVRETWSKGLERYIYRADYSDTEKFYRNGKEIEIKWKPSIRMPKEAARIWLKVTDVRVERLQEITPDVIKNEGIILDPKECVGKFDYTSELYFLFQRLWNSTIKKPDFDRYGWDANPWVWVIEFERCEKPNVN